MRFASSLLLLSLFMLISCSSNQDNIVITKEFPNNEWERFDYLNGIFTVDKAPAKYDIVMEVIVNEDFPNVYENHKKDSSLSFNMTIKNPNNSGIRSKDYRYMLKDNEGNWKADKKDGYYTFKLPIISGMTFGEKGDYNFKIENKYPKDPLYGIKSLTIKCVHSK